MERKYLFFVALFVSIQLMADIPNGYYNPADGKSGNQLRLALQSVIDNHAVVTYDQLYTLFEDADSKDNGDVWDMYSLCVWQHGQKTCGSYSQVCDCYNREHSIPQSWFSKAMPMRSDAFHVYPTDGKVNNQRSNYPFGECNGGSSLNGDALGRCGASTFPGYSGVVFEPDDEYKGDFARTYFYMATRYAGMCETWGHSVFSNSNCGLSDYAVALFLKWHRQDPVSEKERQRNDAIYGVNDEQPYAQRNRNPFIDYPCLAEYIWGSRGGQTVDLSKLMSSYNPDFESSDMSGCYCSDQSNLLLPADGELLGIPGTSLGNSSSSELEIKGFGMMSPLNMTITGTDAAMFSLSTTTISAEDVNKGTSVLVMYSPTSIGTHNAVIEITGADLENKVSVKVKSSSIADLILPADDEFYFSQNNVGQTETVEVMFQASNIHNPISLVLEGKNAASFEVNPKTISATEAMDGKMVSLAYIPNAIGRAEAELVVSCPDFPTYHYPIIGECDFTVLPASDISSNSFVAHWTDAGRLSYKLSVFTKDGVSEPTTLFESKTPDISDWQNAGIQFLNNFYQEADAIRLGTGKGEGELIIDKFNFPDGGKLVISAAIYKSDNSILEVTCNDTEVETITLSSDFRNYEVSIPVNTKSIIIRQGRKGERVLIKSLTIQKNAGTKQHMMLNGFPVMVENATQYHVVGLADLTDYFYCVELPDGTKTDEWQVRTGYGNVSENQFVESERVLHYVRDNNLYLENLVSGSDIYVYTPSGLLVEYRKNCSVSEVFRLKNGIYILSTSVGQNIKVII